MVHVMTLLSNQAANARYGAALFNVQAAGLTLTGTGGDDQLRGTALDDTILGGDGNDSLDGDAGNDILDGGAGNDNLDGGAGDDTLDGGAGDDTLTGGRGTDILRGGDGNDWLVTMDLAGQTDTVLDGGPGNDGFDVGMSVKSVLGGSGDDSISAQYTGSSNGVTPLSIDMGDGNDKFIIEDYRVSRPITISGGAGTDAYHFSVQPLFPAMTILDFEAGPGGDMLDLSMFFDEARGNPFGTAGLLRLVQEGNRVLLQVDRDGVAGSEAFATMIALENVSASALSAANFAEGWRHDGSSLGLTLTGGADTQKLQGGRLDDTLLGGANGEVINGGAGRDVLDGGAGDDQISAGIGSDMLKGGAGNDLLDGEGGLDTAVYAGARAAYELIKENNFGVWSVSDQSGGGDGADQIRGVERLLFADSSLALDLFGVAGQAYRIYRAAFDRTPDEVGLGYWIAALDRGSALHAVAGGFVASAEFRDLYGAAPSNADIVGRLYRNILDREPEQAGFAFWVGMLDTGRDDLAGVLASFSESAENVNAVTPLIAQGIAYQPWG